MVFCVHTLFLTQFFFLGKSLFACAARAALNQFVQSPMYDTPCLNGQKNCTEEEIELEIEVARRDQGADLVDISDTAVEYFQKGELSADSYATWVLVLAKMLDREGRCSEQIKIADSLMTAKTIIDVAATKANPVTALITTFIKCPDGNQPDGQPCGVDEAKVLSDLMMKSVDYVPTMMDLTQAYIAYPIDSLFYWTRMIPVDIEEERAKAQETRSKVKEKIKKWWDDLWY